VWTFVPESVEFGLDDDLRLHLGEIEAEEGGSVSRFEVVEAVMRFKDGAEIGHGVEKGSAVSACSPGGCARASAYRWHVVCGLSRSRRVSLLRFVAYRSAVSSSICIDRGGVSDCRKVCHPKEALASMMS